MRIFWLTFLDVIVPNKETIHEIEYKRKERERERIVTGQKRH
jgi:hypothetical protein